MHQVLPVIPGDSVTPGDSVRPVFTGQEAQKEKIDKCLDRSELPVLNSPGSSVQLEHNVHKQQRNMPNLQAEHLLEYSEVFQDFKNSDSSNVKAYEFSKRTHLPHSEHRPSGIGHTCNPLGITLVTGQTKSMGQSEPDIILMSLVLHGEIVTHVVILFLSNTLTQVNILQLR